MPRTIEKVRSELRHHDAKWKAAHARGDEFYVGYHTAMIAVLENERAELEKAADGTQTLKVNGRTIELTPISDLLAGNAAHKHH